MRKILLTTLLMVFSLLTADAQTIKERYAFEGTLDGKTSVRLAFEVNASKIAAGHIYYPKAKHPAPIMIIGYKHANGMFHLNEYQADGEITGSLSLTISGGKLTGQWTHPRTEKDLTFTNMRSISFPKGFGGLLTPESPNKLGHYYNYNKYQPACAH